MTNPASTVAAAAPDGSAPRSRRPLIITAVLLLVTALLSAIVVFAGPRIADMAGISLQEKVNLNADTSDLKLGLAQTPLGGASFRDPHFMSDRFTCTLDEGSGKKEGAFVQRCERVQTRIYVLDDHQVAADQMNAWASSHRADGWERQDDDESGPFTVAVYANEDGDEMRTVVLAPSSATAEAIAAFTAPPADSTSLYARDDDPAVVADQLGVLVLQYRLDAGTPDVPCSTNFCTQPAISEPVMPEASAWPQRG